MKLGARIMMATAATAALAGSLGCAKLQARDQLVKGVQAFKAGQYEQAVNNFQHAIEKDPDYDTARLYLATAYSYEVTPNVDTPENLKTAGKALDLFNAVLAKNPNDLGALRQEASIYRNIKQYDKAKEAERKVIAAEPRDAVAYYTIGVIDWTQAYKNATTLLAAGGLQDDGMGNAKKSKDVCAKITAQNSALVSEADDSLKKAIDIDPKYDDAMQYMNLNLRRKADMECGNDAARKADVAAAEQWVQKAMAARKANEAEKEKKLSGGVDLSK